MSSENYSKRRPIQSFFSDRAIANVDEEAFPRSSNEIREEKRKEQRRVKMLQQRFTTQNRSFTSGLKLPSIGSADQTNTNLNEGAAFAGDGESDRKARRKNRRRRNRDRNMQHFESSPARAPANTMARPSSRPGSRMGFDLEETQEHYSSSVDVSDDFGKKKRRRKKRKRKKKHRRSPEPDDYDFETNIVYDDEPGMDFSKTYGNKRGGNDVEFGKIQKQFSIQDTFKEIFSKASDAANAALDGRIDTSIGEPQIGSSSKPSDPTSSSMVLLSSTDVEVGNADDMLVEDLGNDFFDDELDDVAVPVKKKGLKIDLGLATALRTIFFGNALRSFSPAWKSQGFVFNTKDQREGQLFGMIQHKGGPCGPCAVMQAFVIKHLLFDQPCKNWMNPTSDEVLNAVTAGLVDALVRAGGGMGCSVALIGGRSGIAGNKNYRADGITECLEIFKMASRTEALQFLSQQHVLEQFTAPNGCGVILFCYSLLLSRGVTRVRKDADPGFGFMQPFIGEFDYASQELVNLGITGCAFSNVFDGVKELKGDKKEDCIRLVGIENISKIGFLTLFEHYGHVEVGNNYKSPRYPIWVVCSESHYSVFFQTPRMAKATTAKSPFELCYYDTLARHEEIIRLTINPQGKHKSDEADPPLEKVLRTKWKNCDIKWIGDAVL